MVNGTDVTPLEIFHNIKNLILFSLLCLWKVQIRLNRDMKIHYNEKLVVCWLEINWPSQLVSTWVPADCRRAVPGLGVCRSRDLRISSLSWQSAVCESEWVAIFHYRKIIVYSPPLGWAVTPVISKHVSFSFLVVNL